MTHKSEFRVYYEDTDAGGVVYYANYLKFAERARTEMLRDCGINQSKLAKDEKVFFVVRHAAIDLMKPARLDDLLTIETIIEKISGASMDIRQHIHVGDLAIATIHIRIACVNAEFVPIRIDQAIKEALFINKPTS